MLKFFTPWLLCLVLAKETTASKLVDSLTNVTSHIVTMSNVIADLSRQCCGPSGQLPMDCSDHLLLGHTTSGVYPIHPSRCYPNLVVNAYCDMTTDGGGWTVFLNREEQEVQENFTRSWDEYSKGFGDPRKEHWLGNSLLHALTNNRRYQLRADMRDFNGTRGWAKYDTFAVDSEANLYKLTVTGYSGTAGDCMWFHHNRNFSTFDSDNDSHEGMSCSYNMKGGFWFGRCRATNPTGIYLGEDKIAGYGVIWRTFTGDNRSLKTFSFKIRPRSCSRFVHYSL